jgi:hypothetical protein
MYTYGWVASSNFEFQAGEWMNSQFYFAEIDTGYLYSPAADFAANQVLYSPTMAGAQTAALTSEGISQSLLPGVVFCYENYLYGNYINGWSGYAAEPSTGPNTVGGAYYTMLNAKPTGSPFVGGTLNYATHNPASADGLNPIYNTNWVWQADLWSEIYDAPLATPPTAFLTPGAWMPYMVSGATTPTSTYGAAIGAFPYGNTAGGVQVQDFSSITISGTTLTGMPGAVPNNAFCMQWDYTTGPCSVTVTNGEAVTYTFLNNMTFTDGVPVTAADYNFSLFALDVANSPAMINAAVYTPFEGADAGPFGLIATTINTAQNSITMYLGDQAVWNVIAVNFPVLPLHLYQYLNLANAFAYPHNIDISQSYASIYASHPGYFQDVGAQTCNTVPAGCTILGGLANLEVSNGPFFLSDYNYATNPNAGVLTANINYYHTAWWDALVPNKVGPAGTITFTVTPQLFTSEPSTYTVMNAANGASGFACTLSLQEWSGAIPASTTNKYVGSHIGSPISAGSDISSNCAAGTFTAGTPISLAIPVSTLTSNKNYQVTFTMTYTYQGLSRVWYQYFGFNVATGSPSVVVGTPTS